MTLAMQHKLCEPKTVSLLKKGNPFWLKVTGLINHAGFYSIKNLVLFLM